MNELQQASGSISYLPFIPKYKDMTNEKKLRTTDILWLKNNILDELEKPWVPDFKKIFEWESLEVVFDTLKDLLSEEIERFKNTISIPKEEINFDTFEHKDRLGLLFTLLGHYKEVENNDKLREIIEEFQPLYLWFANEVAYSKPYYEMLVYCRDNCELDIEQKRIMDKNILSYEVWWVHLPDEVKKELMTINIEIANLELQFWNNTLDSEKDFSLLIEDLSLIDEMPEDTLEVARQSAEAKGLTWYLFTSDYTSQAAVMKYCKDSNIRKKFYFDKSSLATEWKLDNRPIIVKILALKKRKSELLGHDSIAKYSLVEKMAATPEEVIKLLEGIAERAKKKAIAEVEEMKDFFGIEKIEEWDLHYYARILKEKKYEVSEKEVKQYLEYERVLKWLFDIVSKLFDIEMKEIQWEKYSEDLRIYEVRRKDEFISYFVLDPFYRGDKSSWAWMNCLRERSIDDWKRVDYIAVNVSSYQKWADSKTLLTASDVTTIFHEFWHAIHLMLSQSKYSELSWFNVEWDFVEVPSQIMENWAEEQESMKTFAFHNETGEPMPDVLYAKLEKLKKFFTWNFILTQMQYALMDMHIHSTNVPETVEELDSKVKEILEKISIFEVSEKKKPHATFWHIFGWWYTAWYYSYTWAGLYETDIFSHFKKNWIFDKETADKFHDTILSQGTKKPAKELFFDFAWREVQLEPFFEKFWL